MGETNWPEVGCGLQIFPVSRSHPVLAKEEERMEMSRRQTSLGRKGLPAPRPGEVRRRSLSGGGQEHEEEADHTVNLCHYVLPEEEDEEWGPLVGERRA